MNLGNGDNDSGMGPKPINPKQVRILDNEKGVGKIQPNGTILFINQIKKSAHLVNPKGNNPRTKGSG